MSPQRRCGKDVLETAVFFDTAVIFDTAVMFDITV